MYNIRIRMPSGATSRGYNRDDEAEAEKVFESVFSQLTASGPAAGMAVELYDNERLVKGTEIVSVPPVISPGKK